MSEIKVTAIGGGTGLSTMLRGLKKYTSKVTAIVTVADNGGSTGILRKEMNMLAPGDIRNCIIALANTEPVMEELFKYRFEKGSLAGQSFGNLFLAAMNEIYGNFELAVQHTSEILAITGKVLPVTRENVQLWARLNNGSIVVGESQIVEACKNHQLKIEQIELYPKYPKPLKEAMEAINDSDLIIIGPGSLYTSLVPNFLVEGIASAINVAKVPVIYVSNIMTQLGETDNYTITDHIKILQNYIDEDAIDYVIINNGVICKQILEVYQKDGATPIKDDTYLLKDKKITPVYADVCNIDKNKHLLRHHPDKLASIIFDIYNSSLKLQ